MSDQPTPSAPREALRRSFNVDVPIEQAWDHLADLGNWPKWAPHIRSITVEPEGPLGPSSSGKLLLRGGLRATFRMTIWEPPRRWVWVGRAGGLTVHYAPRFAPGVGGATTLLWIVSLSGIGSRVARRPFALGYGRNVDRAIPLLQAEPSRAAPSDQDRPWESARDRLRGEAT